MPLFPSRFKTSPSLPLLSFQSYGDMGGVEGGSNDGCGVCVCVCVCVCMHVHTQSYLFVTPLHCSLLGSSVHGIFQSRILVGVAISYFKGSSRLRDLTCISCVSCVGRWILYHWRQLRSSKLLDGGIQWGWGWGVVISSVPAFISAGICWSISLFCNYHNPIR